MDSINLEQISYLGETVAAIAVVISLIYVGKQINLNTQEPRLAAFRNVAALWGDKMHTVAGDQNFAEILHRAEQDFDTLDSVDRKRVLAYISGWFMMTDADYFAYQAGAFDSLPGITAVWRKNFSFRVYREAWKLEGDFYSPGLQAFYDKLINEAEKPVATAPENTA